MNAAEIRQQLRKLGSKKRAEVSKWFFKTGKGEYGEGDVFLGLNADQMHALAKTHQALPENEVLKLLHSKIHEERLLALLIWVRQFARADAVTKKRIYRLYLSNTRWINNWDLVDCSAPRVVGAFRWDNDKTILRRFAKSGSLWERRIAIISTQHFIRCGEFSETLKVAKLLLRDEEDLIHKAVGWMLREVGKRDLAVEEKFLRVHYKKMPRTMLRYAIEKFPEAKRQRYLKSAI